ncbi:MAG: monovalent cation/H+ antiporter complex subunit F [Pseudoclavibacter sp.]|nr:monovalent cation/H+ antiporter complex subunit F [Pseudoclavibacter sp.]
MTDPQSSGVLLAAAWIAGGMFAVGAMCTIVRMIKGPTIVDRMVASDTLLTIVLCVLGADMILRGEVTQLHFMLALALTSFIASVAVARYVTRLRSGGQGHEERSKEWRR